MHASLAAATGESNSQADNIMLHGKVAVESAAEVAAKVAAEAAARADAEAAAEAASRVGTVLDLTTHLR